MPLSSCARCEGMFDKKGSLVVCPDCLPDEEADYEKVRTAMQEHPEMSAESLAEIAEVEMSCISRFLQDGRIETTLANKTVRCGRCGARGISLSKRLCEGCLQKLNSELTAQQSQIQLSNKKRVDVSTAFGARDKSNVVKHQR